MAKAINWMIEHPEEAKKMGNKGKVLVRKMLNIEETSTKIYKIYKKIVVGE